MARYKQKYTTAKDSTRESWAAWLLSYGADKFFDSFLKTAQGAESQCVNCHQPIYLDIVVGGGVPDWGTEDGDFGCGRSPDTNDEGTGSHVPRKAAV